MPSFPRWIMRGAEELKNGNRPALTGALPQSPIGPAAVNNGGVLFALCWMRIWRQRELRSHKMRPTRGFVWETMLLLVLSELVAV